MSESNGTLRARKPQLSDSIERLDGLIEELGVALPGAVADCLREALGPAFAAAIRDAVSAAVVEALKGAAPVAASQPVQIPPPPAPPARPVRVTTGAWTKAKAVLGRLRRWATRTAAPVLAHTALGWAVAKMIGSATVRSRVSVLVTALTGTAAGLLGFVLGPVGASVLLGLTASSVTAITVWAAPTIRLFAALRDD